MEYDEFYENSDIEYELIARVDGQVAGIIKDYDLEVVKDKAFHLEEEVAQLVHSNFQDKADEAREEFEMSKAEK